MAQYMSVISLPAYDDISGRTIDADAPPPSYSAPTQFVIGKSITDAPLVGIQEIKRHLDLMRAFAELKNAVDAVESDMILAVPLDKQQRWVWFVGCAVERFDIWCRSLRPSDSTVAAEIILPPADVIMVWHAYMLNPRCFAEDCIRRDSCKRLSGLERQFKECLRGKFLTLLSLPPSQARINFWWTKTSQPFEYSLDGVGAIKQKRVRCHRCSRAVSVDLINPEGTGYLQKSFAFDCPNSHGFKSITKERLAVRKLADDLAGPPSLGLSGAVFTSSPQTDKTRVDKIKHHVVLCARNSRNLRKAEEEGPSRSEKLSLSIASSVAFSMDSLRSTMAGPSAFIQTKIMNAYFDDKIYSIELVGAVLRQESFVRQMYDLGWTRQGFFDAEIDELALHNALTRYHAFLDLMSSASSLLVPTLDIDLVWHTHQLMPTSYKGDCERYVNRFIDHDDKIEGLRLSSAFDMTCRSWKSRFNVNYTHCGCPVPGDTIGKRLSRLIGMPQTSSTSSSSLVPDDRPDLLSATHPSEHNAVRFLPLDEPHTCRQVERDYEKLKAEKEKRAEKRLTELHPQRDAPRPHAPALDESSNKESRYHQYSGTFLVAVPVSMDVVGCISAEVRHIHSFGPCGGKCGGSCTGIFYGTGCGG